MFWVVYVMLWDTIGAYTGLVKEKYRGGRGAVRGLEFFQFFENFWGVPGYTLRFLASIETTLIPINEILKKNLGTLYLEILTNHRQNKAHLRASNWLFWAVSCLYFLLSRWWGLIILTTKKKSFTYLCAFFRTKIWLLSPVTIISQITWKFEGGAGLWFRLS